MIGTFNSVSITRRLDCCVHRNFAASSIFAVANVCGRLVPATVDSSVLSRELADSKSMACSTRPGRGEQLFPFPSEALDHEHCSQ
jgi:hypothetical protein